MNKVVKGILNQSNMRLKDKVISVQGHDGYAAKSIAKKKVGFEKVANVRLSRSWRKIWG